MISYEFSFDPTRDNFHAIRALADRRGITISPNGRGRAGEKKSIIRIRINSRVNKPVVHEVVATALRQLGHIARKTGSDYYLGLQSRLGKIWMHDVQIACGLLHKAAQWGEQMDAVIALRSNPIALSNDLMYLIASFGDPPFDSKLRESRLAFRQIMEQLKSRQDFFSQAQPIFRVAMMNLELYWEWLHLQENRQSGKLSEREHQCFTCIPLRVEL